MQGKQGRICEIVLNVHRTNDDEVWHSNTKFRIFKIWDYKRLVQGKRGKICEIILNVYRKISTKFNTVIGSLESQRKHIEKYIDEKKVN